MKSFFLAVVIVLSSLFVKHGAIDVVPVTQQTPIQPITEHNTFNLTVKNNCIMSMICTGTPKQNVTRPHEVFHNSVGHPENGISVRGNTTGHSEEQNLSTSPWVWVVCVIVIILFFIPGILLLVPRFRQRLKFIPFSPSTGVSGHQEMPQTKQDVTEIQWDLAWMEMANLLDKQHYPGS